MIKFRLTTLSVLYILCSSLAQTAFAQFTTVTATVKDPNGIPYAGAVMNAVLVPGASGGYTLGGQPYSGRIGPVTLDSTGSFTVNFGDVTLITPGSPQWQITIDSASATLSLSLGTGPQTFTLTSSGTTISGSSPVSLTSSLNALAPKLTNFAAGSGTVTNVTGTSPIVSSGGATPALSCPTCNTSTPLAPNSAGIPTNNGPSAFYVANTTGFHGDTYSVFDAVCSNGSNVVTSTSAHFLSAKIAVGQTVWAVPGGGQGNAAPSIPKTTILSIDSDTQIHVTANGNAGCGSSQFLVWGDDDFPAIHNNFEPAFYAASLTNCAIAHLPGAGIMVSGGVINRPAPASCLPAQTYSAYGMVGEGVTNSVFYPTPDFDPTTCTGSGKLNCFGPWDGVRHDFGINGGGLSATASPSTVFNVLTVLSPQSIHDVSCLYWGNNQANMTGFSTGTGQLFVGQNVEIANCGGANIAFAGGGNGGIVHGNYFNPNGTQIVVSSPSPGLDFFSNFISASGTQECASNTSGFQSINGSYMGPGAEMCCTGGHVRINGTIASHSQAIAGRAAFKELTGCVASVSNSSFTDTGAGEFAVSVDATSQFNSAGNNTFSGNINIAPGGIWTGPDALNGTCSGTATASSTLGLYGLGQNTVLSCTSTTVNIGIAAKKAGTLTGFNVTAATGGVNASSGVVTVLKNNVASALTCTIGTSTGCSDNAHTVSVALGDIISIQFTTQGGETLAGVKAQIILE